MYPEDMIAPMRAELANSGYAETKTPEEVTAAITAEGTTLVVVNSVCGCAAGSARPAAMAAAKSEVKPDRMITVFAGNDKAAVDEARSTCFRSLHLLQQWPCLKTASWYT